MQSSVNKLHIEMVNDMLGIRYENQGVALLNKEGALDFIEDIMKEYGLTLSDLEKHICN